MITYEEIVRQKKNTIVLIYDNDYIALSPGNMNSSRFFFVLFYFFARETNRLTFYFVINLIDGLFVLSAMLLFQLFG